jgi:hypothetical protein
MRRFALLALLSACATQEANLGTTEHETPRWAIGLGDRGYESMSSVAFDSLGDVVVAGQGHLWPADLGNGTIGSYEDWGFLSKRVASDGSSRWSIAFPGFGQYAGAQISSVAIDSDDSIVVGGSYMGTVHFGDQELASSDPGDSFIAKYSTDGTLTWLWNMGAQSATTVVQISLDHAGNIFATGRYGYTAVNFLGEHPATQPQPTGFLISLDPNGVPRWGRFLDTAPGAYIEGEGLTSAGDVVVAGTFSGTGSFGGATLDATAPARGFIARYRNDGLYLWSHTFGIDNGQTSAAQLAILGNDHIAVTDTETPTGSITNSPGRLIQLDGDGHLLWTMGQTDSDDPSFGELAVRPNGDLVAAKWREIGASNSVPGHIEIMTIDPDGHFSSGDIGSRVYQDYRSTRLAASAIGPHGELAVVGEFAGSIDLGFGPLVTHGTDDTDAFVLVVEPPAD